MPSTTHKLCCVLENQENQQKTKSNDWAVALNGAEFITFASGSQFNQAKEFTFLGQFNQYRPGLNIPFVTHWDFGVDKGRWAFRIDALKSGTLVIDMSDATGAHISSIRGVTDDGF